MENYTEQRPWGYFTVLTEQENFKIKQIVVYTGKRLSLQRHKHRSEHWYVLQGTACVTLNDKKIILQLGQSVDIPVTAVHRVENIGANELKFIEIQTGSYFGEDDIERLQDDFNRVDR